MRNFTDKGAASLYGTSSRLSLLSEAFGAGVAFPTSVRHVRESVKRSSKRRGNRGQAQCWLSTALFAAAQCAGTDLHVIVASDLP